MKTERPEILLIASSSPERSSLRDLVRELQSHGHTVRLACLGDTAPLHSVLEGTRQLRANLPGLRRGRRPRRLSARWASDVAKYWVLQVYSKASDIATTTWITAKHDPWIKQTLPHVDILIALDPGAVLAVERLHRRSPHVRALSSVAPILRDLRQLSDAAATLAAASQTGFQSVTLDDVGSAWNRLREEPTAPVFESVLRNLPRLVRSLRRSGSLKDALRVASEGHELLIDDEVRSWIDVELAIIRIAQFGAPVPGLGDAMQRLLRYADDRLRTAQIARAADILVTIMEAAFYPELHTQVAKSLLVDSPESFLAPLHDSFAYQMLGSQPHVEASAAGPPSPGQVSGTRRLLMVSSGNLHFARGIIDDLTATSDTEVRILNPVAEDRKKFGRWWASALTFDRLATVSGRSLSQPSREEQEVLSWPDTVFVEWCDHAAVWAAMHLPEHVRMIVRIHSFEALSQFPHLMDWSRVSDVIFVGDHVRDFLARAVPTLVNAGRIHVLPNEMQLDHFGLPKRPGAHRTVAMVGWSQRVKDPIWALEVIALLRAESPQWRLMLVGRDFTQAQTPSGSRYRDRFLKRIKDPAIGDALVFVDHTDELPEVLRGAGFVLSASRREGFPVGVTEAAASAAVPVIRDWPLYARYDGARRVFPADWVVTDPADAAVRILAHADEKDRRPAGENARLHVVKNFDWPAIAPRYREIILGS